MKLIIGLGNPDKSYEKTRHNVGFMVLEELVRTHGSKFKSEHDLFWSASFEVGDQEVVLVKPKTYMNQSGEAVLACLKRFNEVTPRDLLVVVDDVNLPIGKLRLRAKGSAGGHHGLESIIGSIGTKEFPRLRIGVGREGLSGTDLTDYVLGKFDSSEEKAVRNTLVLAGDACLEWVAEGPQAAMSRFNKIWSLLFSYKYGKVFSLLSNFFGKRYFHL